MKNTRLFYYSDVKDINFNKLIIIAVNHNFSSHLHLNINEQIPYLEVAYINDNRLYIARRISQNCVYVYEKGSPWVFVKLRYYLRRENKANHKQYM